ncbi:MAG: DUF1684 domain-containing protein [Herpetosiphonaceae bacterium]|nr:DUF1684 domain-containing protein [Herpetosiphonaceae bacterium]
MVTLKVDNPGLPEQLALVDYRRCVAELYASVREGPGDPEVRWQHYRAGREHLFASHPQSPLSPAQQAHFHGLEYFPYDPALRFAVPLDTAVDAADFTLELRDDGPVRMRRCGRVNINIENQPVSLSLFWILGYGGGLFLPFRDQTNSHETYGGGRYLLDTIKHADLGQEGDRLVLDFNYAYNPSCAYNERWQCPLAPVENRLPVAVRAGEHAYPSETARGSPGTPPAR